MRAGYCRSGHADQIRCFPRRPSGSLILPVRDEGEAAMAARKNTKKDAASGSLTASPRPGNDGAEVAEEHVEVVTYAAAIDVAKGSGMVCTRVPGSRPDRRRQTVWQGRATYASVVALMDHLRCQGIQRLVPGSTSDYWRIWGGPEAHCRIARLTGRDLRRGSWVWWPSPDSQRVKGPA